MRKLQLAFFVVAASLGLASCAGSGVAGPPSPFIGEFAGTWAVSGGDTGTADLTIVASGHLTGTITDTTLSVTGSITGHIHADGSITTTTTLPAHAPIGATGTWALSNGNQTLSGSLTTTGNNPHTGDYNLTRQ